MAGEEQSLTTSASRRGFWIFVGTAVFTAGYPVLMSLTFGRHSTLTLTALIFMVLALFTGLGFGWARILNVLMCGVVVAYLLTVLVSLLGMGVELIDERWPIFVMLPVLPLVGYAASFALLCTPSVSAWQQTVRERRAVHRRAYIQQLETPIRVPENVALERCPWCDAVAVNPHESVCLSCNRPVG